MQYYTSKTNLELGVVYKLREKKLFSQPLPCEEIAVKFVKKKYQQIIYYLFNFIVIVFFLYTKLKIYEDSYFKVCSQLNVVKYVLKKLQS